MYTIQNGLILLTGIYIVLINNFKNKVKILNNNIFKIIILLIIVLISKNNISLGLLLFIAYILSISNNSKIENFVEESPSNTPVPIPSESPAATLIPTTNNKLPDNTTPCTVDGFCMDGYGYCNIGEYCKGVSRMGLPRDKCLFDVNCLSGSCENGVCGKLPEGLWCDSNDDCKSNICTKGNCDKTSLPVDGISNKIADKDTTRVCTNNEDCLNGNCIAGVCNPTDLLLNQKPSENCVSDTNCSWNHAKCVDGVCGNVFDNVQLCILNSECVNVNGYCNNGYCDTPLGQPVYGYCVSDMNCNEGLTCSNGRCIIPDNTGNCSSNEQCLNGNCIGGICNPTKTSLKQELYEKCVADINCRNGELICNNGICNKRLDNTYGCISDDDCVNGNCINGYCNPTKTSLSQSSGENCVADINCKNNMKCRNKKCLIQLNDTCTSTSDNYSGYCISGHCKENKCVTTLNRNDRCNNDDRECNNYNYYTNSYSNNYECKKDGSSKRYCK